MYKRILSSSGLWKIGETVERNDDCIEVVHLDESGLKPRWIQHRIVFAVEEHHTDSANLAFW